MSELAIRTMREAENPLGVFPKHDKAVVSSRTVARVFEKRHDNVLRDIDSLVCSDDFWCDNFKQGEYRDPRGQLRPEILMTQEGFVFLALGLQGETAAQFREWYVSHSDNARNALKWRPTHAHKPVLGYVYVAEDSLHRVKIGVSNAVEARMAQIASGGSCRIVQTTSRCFENKTRVERQLHKWFAKYRLRGEWFAVPFCVASHYLTHYENYANSPFDVIADIDSRLANEYIDLPTANGNKRTVSFFSYLNYMRELMDDNADEQEVVAV